MTNTPTPEAVDALLDQLLVCDDAALDSALADSAAAGLPAIAVSPQQGKFLNLLATATRATRILEIGTLGGYSTIWLARAVGEGGSVVTCEYEPKHAEVARANLDRAGVGDRVQILVGPALESLPTISGEPFDLVFIDADKENNPAYLQWAVRLARPGAVVLVDNVIREGSILDPKAGDVNANGSREALELLGAHPQLQGAAVQTVGAKGWDGFAFAVVQ